MYNHNKAQQSKNRVHISWDILYKATKSDKKIYIAWFISNISNLVLGEMFNIGQSTHSCFLLQKCFGTYIVANDPVSGCVPRNKDEVWIESFSQEMIWDQIYYFQLSEKQYVYMYIYIYSIILISF